MSPLRNACQPRAGAGFIRAFVLGIILGALLALFI